MGQLDIAQLGCGTSLFQHFRSSKFLDKKDKGPVTQAHINGYIDACKWTDILRNNFHSRISTGWESS